MKFWKVKFADSRRPKHFRAPTLLHAWILAAEFGRKFNMGEVIDIERV